MPLYLEANRFDDQNSGFKLVLGLSYPFECYEFETNEERDAALIDELDYLTRFMSRSAWRQSGLNPGTQGEHLESERAENGLDPEDASIHLVEMTRLAEFDSIQKFKVSKQEIIDAIRRLGHRHGLRMSKSELYVIQETTHLHDETSSLENDDQSQSDGLYFFT